MCQKLAAEEGFAETQCDYAIALHFGLGGAVDWPQARIYFKLAADQDIAYAQFNYAIIPRQGEEVKNDLIGARQYYKLAAGQQSNLTLRMFFILSEQHE